MVGRGCHCHRSFSCLHYYIIILYRDFRRGSFVPAERGVMCSHVRHWFCPFIKRACSGFLSLSLSLSTPCLRLHKRRGTWFLCFLIFTCAYILDIILPRSRSWSILKENISLRDKTMMPRAVERIMRRRGKERGMEELLSIVRGSWRTFNEVYVTGLVIQGPATNRLVSC